MCLFLCYIINRHELGGVSSLPYSLAGTSVWQICFRAACRNFGFVGNIYDALGGGDFAGSVAFFWWADDFNGSNLLLQKCCINTTLAVPRIQYQLFIQMYNLVIEDNT